jgi:hypothetical protein
MFENLTLRLGPIEVTRDLNFPNVLLFSQYCTYRFALSACIRIDHRPGLAVPGSAADGSHVDHSACHCETTRAQPQPDAPGLRSLRGTLEGGRDLPGGQFGHQSGPFIVFVAGGLFFVSLLKRGDA